MDDLKDYGYLDLIKIANQAADNNDLPSILTIKSEIERRIEARGSKDQNPSWGSLMAFYEISTIIDSLNENII